MPRHAMEPDGEGFPASADFGPSLDGEGFTASADLGPSLDGEGFTASADIGPSLGGEGFQPELTSDLPLMERGSPGSKNLSDPWWSRKWLSMASATQVNLQILL